MSCWSRSGRSLLLLSYMDRFCRICNVHLPCRILNFVHTKHARAHLWTCVVGEGVRCLCEYVLVSVCVCLCLFSRSERRYAAHNRCAKLQPRDGCSFTKLLKNRTQLHIICALTDTMPLRTRSAGDRNDRSSVCVCYTCVHIHPHTLTHTHTHIRTHT